jgi:serine/threonine-protein kinase 24/25/MST4
MLSTSADVKLIDFGLTRDMADGPQTHMVGSPYWMPPEMIRKEPHGLPVDLWSSGICILELMNGKPPNRDNSLKAMFLVGIGEAPGPATTKWSLECVKFVEALLTVSQTERPTSKTMLEHAFLKRAASNQAMQKMLQQIFLSQTFGGDSKKGGGGGAGIF